MHVTYGAFVSRFGLMFRMYIYKVSPIYLVYCVSSISEGRFTFISKLSVKIIQQVTLLLIEYIMMTN